MASTPDRWIDRPLRILDFAYNAHIDDYPMEKVVEVCRRMHANVIHFHCQFNMGGGANEHGFYFSSRLAKKKNRDVLGEFLPLARDAGIRTVVYANLHWFTSAFADEHPDWCVITPDGSRMNDLYGDNDSTFCINSPWRDWSFTLLEDLCAYPLDGVFFDGPVFFLRRGACSCASCTERHLERTGKELPAHDPSDRASFALLREHAVSSMVDYYHDAVAACKRTRPEVMCYANFANVAEPDWSAGRHNRRLIPELDALLAEGGFMYGRAAKGAFKTGASSRLYQTQAGGKPAGNAVSMAYSPWRWISLSPPETRLLLSQASTGVNPYYAIFIQGLESEGVRAAEEVYAFLEKNEEYYENNRSAARVAMLQSTQTLSCYSGVDVPWTDLGYQKEEKSKDVGNFTRSFYGFYEMLVRSRIPFDVVDEESLLEGALDRYQVLVLTNAACLSDEQCRAIRDFVQAGGTLVSDFESSHYDETGERRRDLGLSDVMGVVSSSRVSPHRRWDYILVATEHDAILGSPESGVLPAPRRNLEVRLDGGRAVGVFSEPLASNIVASAVASDAPFLVEHQFGEGTSWYFPCTFGEFFEECRPQHYASILAGLIGDTAVPVRVTGPSNMIDVQLRSQPDHSRTLVHLANHEMSSIDRCIPAVDVRLEVREELLGHEVTRARALRAGIELDPKNCVLPELEEYEVVVLES